jgi:alkane 1-monooxygenase
MHFTIEHLYGHHKWVSTPHDPATAAQGITLYKFIPKSIVGSYLSAFKTNPFFVALSTVIEVLFVGAIWKFYDTKTMIFFLSYALGGILILELINYIEHYGLQRKLKEDGTYERVNIRHSWNAPHRLSNYLFFKLQRHSDHHENGLKPYQTLCSYEDSPQLPHGYLVCMLLACYPKVNKI